MDQELTLSDYITVLRRRWWLVFVGVVAFSLLGLLWSLLQTPQYRSVVRVLVDTDSAAEIFDPVTGQARGARAMTNEAEFANSFQVETAAKQTLTDQGFGVIADSARVSASQSVDADVLQITGTGLSGAGAATAAQTYALIYIEQRREEVVNEYLATAGVVERQLQAVEQELDELGDDESAQRRILEARLSAFGDALTDLNVSAELGGSRATIISPGRVPQAPFTPQTTRNVLLGAVMGLLAGVGAALLFDALDDSIGGRADIEAVAPSVPNLAVIPTVRDWRERAATRIVSVERPQGQEAEAYRGLRAALEFASIDGTVKTLQVTSAGPGEGKTTTAVNLAVTLARSGKRVILADCDLRKPRIHSFFDAPLEPGLTTVILGQSDVGEVLNDVERDAGVLQVVSSGPLPPGPSELLGSERTAAVLTELASMCDLLIVDSAPVLPVSDALVLAGQTDATIVVANGASTSKAEFAEALFRLQQTDVRVMGTVLNQVSRRGNSYGYGYGYGYGYEQDDSGTGSQSAGGRALARR